MNGPIALLGASSKIARDLVLSHVAAGAPAPLLLYVRDVAGARRWLEAQGLEGRFAVHAYADYGSHPHDAVINFVGIGDPVKTAQMGGDIFTVTQQYDDMVLRALADAPARRYLFLSSGAAYGSRFDEPAGPDTPALFPVNALGPQDFYGLAKLHAEARHRALPQYAITDLRVFNYFSRTQDLEARFLITDILRAIRDGTTLQTSAAYMVRDYLHPHDFHALATHVLAAPPRNRALDCYTLAPVDKPTLLAAMHDAFGLRYDIVDGPSGVSATGAKPHYYSRNRAAADTGYVPRYGSLDGLLVEARAVLAAQA